MAKLLLSKLFSVKQWRSLFQFLQLPGKGKPLVSKVVWTASLSTVVSSTLVTGLLLGIQQLGGLETQELWVFDQFMQLRSDTEPDPRLLIVTITEQDLHRYRWPLSDQILAQALGQLQFYRPHVIGLDLYRDLSHPPGGAALATQLQASNVIGITEIIGNIPAPPGIEAERIGFNDFTLDADGVLRRNLLLVADSEKGYYSFALRMSLAYLQAEGIAFRYTPEALFLGKRTLVPLEPTSGGYQTADTRGYQILLRYRNRSHVAQTVTLSQLLEGQVDPDWVRDKIVLIGTIAPSLKDHVYTPYSAGQQDRFQMSGVIIHAQMISQLLEIASGKPWLFQFWSQASELLWLWSWSLVGGFLVWRLRHPLAFGCGGIVCLLLIGGISWGLFIHWIWIPVAEPVLGFIVAVGFAISHRLLYTSTRDSFTGLLNRGAFLSRLQRSLTQQSRQPNSLGISVLFLQIDRFHLIRKQVGDSVSDRLLLQMITQWRTNLPRSAQLARVSDDEFAIVLLNHPEAALTDLATHLQAVQPAAFLVHHPAIAITTSIGIASLQEQNLYQAENLLRDAHLAMYRAKALGTGRYAVFATGMLTESVNRFTLENEMRRGIQAQEFILYYQPIVHLQTGKIAGFEALVRWQHPQQGLISPLTFIPLAEETGLILSLGQWIYRTACLQTQQWQQQFPSQSLIMSINLSGRQFEQPDLVEQLAQILEELNLEAATLKLEITESMLMGDVEAAIDGMLRLKSLGCKLGMDDFGTGYSSLSQIRRFPIDTLKVDRSFVQKMGKSHEDHEIVRMIITLGHTLGMDVIAEGVETQEDADTLRSLGCELGQGYFWAKPLPTVEATLLLEKQAQEFIRSSTKVC